MNMYEVILNMIDKQGPASIPSICKEINKNPVYMQERGKPVQQAHVKSVISRKRELFLCENEMVSLLPDKELISLTVNAGACRGPWVKIDVDFMRNIFTYFEWNLDPVQPGKTFSTPMAKRYDTIVTGNIDDFKQELYRLKIWDWNPSYETEGIVLDGINWSIRLETKAKVYKSEGLQKFPNNWIKFCKALTYLTGKKFV
ncbi:hypothetical protein [Bacillus benzoevorans]|uniref:Uncharacterized protein n=1 Tax=Bacillus benzoevorans TaxID=1456 RepID=A0A7X0HSN0_9BACI|nr:hypothetical protein [Bacillus benzoevorans]MBB6445172.1 hypothetical protein [Bacillus benzoevorans]